uniref:Uncharacterized protein n=1 Tax=Nelumbo nucifera TaxID=4432 RepID=A0A822XMZ6_NELNU|nr:TPA_asm: hypothetical protein HUJ06_022885 [Nelumbo nucifera]
MARALQFFPLLLLLSSTLFFTTEGRPFNMLIKSVSFTTGTDQSIEGFTDTLSLGAIKNSGPSPGTGNKFTNSQTLGGMKISSSSPSPGVGHRKFINVQTLGGIKNSGPSPDGGGGHSFTNAQTLGGIKNSGPSPGTGNSFINARRN